MVEEREGEVDLLLKVCRRQREARGVDREKKRRARRRCSLLRFFRIRHARLLPLAFTDRENPLSLTSAAGFLREKVRRASLGVEKPGAAFCAFCVAAAVACLLLARGAAPSFSLLLCVSSNRFAAVAADAAARPRRGGMVDKRRREKTKEEKDEE